MQKSKLFLAVMAALIAVIFSVLGGCENPVASKPTYTVTFDTQGGSGVAAITGVPSGGRIDKPANPVKSGHTFADWYKEAACTTAWQFTIDTVQANITLYAKWTAMEQAAVPVASPQAGTVPAGTTVTLTTATAGAVIYYTVDGADPAAENGTLYTVPLIIDAAKTVKAVAKKDGMKDSGILTAAYTIGDTMAAAPGASEDTGAYNTAQSVTLTTTTEGGSIYYTVNGTDPTAENGTPYTGPIAIDVTTTLKAVTVKAGLTDSPVMVRVYTLKADTPVASLPGDTYTTAQSVTLTTTTEGGSIYYTVNGTSPSDTSTLYTGPVAIGVGATTLKAVAVKSGWTASDVLTETYTVTPDPLKFSLSGSFGNGGHLSLQSGETPPSASIMRSVAAEDDISYPLEGVLEYDDVLVRLRGSYAPNSGNWSVSARYGEGDSDAVYTFDGNGGYEDAPLRKAGATVMMPDGGHPGEWLPAFFPVTESGTAWSPNGEVNDSVTEGGMPPEMHGYWSASWDMPILSSGTIHMTMQCLISDWKITATGRRVSTYEDRVIKQNQNIVEIEEVSEGVYNVISCYLEYQERAVTLKAALTEWLGLGKDGITVWDGEEKPNGPWIKDNQGMPYPETGGFSDKQWEEVQSFYAANGWEIWVANNTALWEGLHPNGPIVKYAKYQFSSDGDHLNMTKMVEGTDQWYADTFYDLGSAQEKAVELEHKWFLPEGGSADWENLGVLTVPFTR